MATREQVENALARGLCRVKIISSHSAFRGRLGTCTQFWEGDGTAKMPPAAQVRLDSKHEERRVPIAFALSEIEVIG